jgi:hypothetical protein
MKPHISPCAAPRIDLTTCMAGGCRVFLSSTREDGMGRSPHYPTSLSAPRGKLEEVLRGFSPPEFFRSAARPLMGVWWRFGLVWLDMLSTSFSCTSAKGLLCRDES